MRISTITAIAGLTVSTAAIGTAAAVVGHHHPHVTPVVVRADHHVCKKTVVNGLTDKGTAIITAYCGVSKTYLRARNGKLTPVTLPKADGRYVDGSNIASNGILAVIGHRTATSRLTSYLIRRNGTVVRLNDPAAGTNSTIVNAVNRHGVAVGDYCLNHKCSLQQAFIYRNGLFRDFSLHHKGAVLPSLNMISDSGALFGYYLQKPSGYLRGFVKSGHKVRVVDAPQAGRKLGQGTAILGAGNHGAICGDVFGKHKLSAAFAEHHGHMHVVNLHPAQRHSYTELLACNSRGEIGGHSYNTNTRLSEGFLGKVH